MDMNFSRDVLAVVNHWSEEARSFRKERRALVQMQLCACGLLPATRHARAGDEEREAAEMRSGCHVRFV